MMERYLVDLDDIQIVSGDESPTFKGFYKIGGKANNDNKFGVKFQQSVTISIDPTKEQIEALNQLMAAPKINLNV